jgi:hypothetical protein
MKRQEILQKYIDLENNNLFCYSANYLMTKPWPEYEIEWRRCKELVEGLEEIRAYVRLHEIPGFIRKLCSGIDLKGKTKEDVYKILGVSEAEQSKLTPHK